MVTYDSFAKWLQDISSTASDRSKTKHSVGVTESKLEEHKVMYMQPVHTYSIIYVLRLNSMIKVVPMTRYHEH